MKKIIIPDALRSRVLPPTIGLGLTSLLLFTFFLVDIFRARVIDIDYTMKILKEKHQKENKNFGISKVVFQKGFNDKGPDLRCITWSSKLLYSGWNNDKKDRDFFIDYYVPSGKKAIICATPALAASLSAHPKKRFLYEVSKTELDDGLYVRVVVGVSEVRETCKLVTGSVDCANSILGRQAIVKYEP
ncbi:hypothetical protein [Fischerella sp. PCC 9605]|uniref:hypothetical protein n=1 Tax=Fischerella sp. PCC 9605 TaxID=1173024 RepID=UPI00047D5914|nr:hypothetical protein [Fischerella sp. PCC 9605]